MDHAPAFKLDRLQKVIENTPLTAFQRDDLLGRVELYRYESLGTLPGLSGLGQEGTASWDRSTGFARPS